VRAAEGPNVRKGRTPGGLDTVMVQKSRQLELPLESRGEAPRVERRGQTESATSGHARPGTDLLLEKALERPNLLQALKRVQQNRGSPGSDGMTVDELPDHLRANWLTLREQLLTGRYQPRPVRRFEIPKPDGGKRELGIPTVLDRFVQQALLQVLQPLFDGSFSEHSHGFRPGRRAHDAICEARRYVQSGKRWVVDVDLEKFFDRVNHDVLMSRLARRITDKRVLGLIRRYLTAGVLADGVVVERHEGTPQGGPLSPLLANVLLDEVDQELERRSHTFVRYADDLRVYVGSRRSGQRVMDSLIRLFGKLRLKVNHAKSAVARAWDRPFLGFAFWAARGGRVAIRVAAKSIAKMKVRVRRLTRRVRGRSLDQIAVELRRYLLGWKGYFGLAETPGVMRDLDEWIRHRLRAVQLKHWKRGRTIYRELVVRGMSPTKAKQVAVNARSWWRNSALGIHTALPNSLFDELGVPRLAT
jgi:group II intron reverse transcriptase/maturase